MQNRLDYVTLGKVAGILVILVGLGMTIWQAWDFGSDFGTSSLIELRIRYITTTMITYVFYGGLLILAAEAVQRLGWLSTTDDSGAADPDSGSAA